MNEKIVPLTSITYAIKAQNALRAQGIRAAVTRDERYLAGKGCGYALVMPANTDMQRVMWILKQQRIKLA